MTAAPGHLEPRDEALLWLRLFKAETEEELERIKDLGVPVMEQAIDAYRSLTASKEFREMERLRERARLNEASALRHAKEQGREQGRLEADEMWKGEVTRLKGEVAKKDAIIAELRSRLGEDGGHGAVDT